MPSSRSILGAATAAHAVVGAWIATSMTGPLLAIDDLAYLSMGRTLAGGGASPLPAQPPYGVLYPVLLAPGWLVGLGEAHMIVFAQILNAVIGAALLPVLYVVVRRLSDASFGRALGAAAIGASLPAALLTGTIVWTERLLPLLAALAVLTLLRLRSDPCIRRGLEVAVVAVALFATHPRTIVVGGVVMAVALWTIWSTASSAPSSARRRTLVVTAAAGLAGAALAELSRRALAQAAFGADATYDAADLARSRGLDEVSGMVVRGGGTVAYLVLATAGLAVLGAGVLWQHREIAVAYGAMLVATVVVAGWFLVGVERADAYLHGRYVEVFAPLLVALGVIAARQLPWRTGAAAVGGSVVLAGLYGAWAGPGNIWVQSRTPVMMLGTEVSGAPFGQRIFEPGAAASVALLAGLLVLAAARGRAWEAPFIAGLLIVAAVMSGSEAIESLQERSIVGQVQAGLADVDGIEALVIDPDRVPTTLAGAVAWEVGFERTSTVRSVDTTHVLLPPGERAPDGAAVVAEFPGGVLWALD